jgi:phi13 family phage major tail protein
MAKIGLDNFLYGTLTEAQDGSPTYGVATKPGKAVNCSVSISNNSASLYADNGLAESDTSFQNGTVSMEIDNADITTQANLLGHSVDSDTGAMTRNVDDVAPYVGFGRIVTKMVNGVYKYKVEFLHKVKFSEPSQEDTTRGETVEFGTTTIEGVVSSLATGKWSTTATFDTKAEAQTYLNSFFTASA